jgi:hypothetical protein
MSKEPRWDLSASSLLGGYAEEGEFGKVGKRFSRSAVSNESVIRPGVFCAEATSLSALSGCLLGKATSRMCVSLSSRVNEFRKDDGSRDVDRCRRCFWNEDGMIASTDPSGDVASLRKSNSWSSGLGEGSRDEYPDLGFRTSSASWSFLFNRSRFLSRRLFTSPAAESGLAERGTLKDRKADFRPLEIAEPGELARELERDTGSSDNLAARIFLTVFALPGSDTTVADVPSLPEREEPGVLPAPQDDCSSVGDVFSLES